jgi:hypothetical protein
MVGAVELLGLAASLSLLAGWRLYAVVLATGLAMRAGFLDLPQHLDALDALASWWVIGAAGIGFVAEFFVDKLAWVDSLWDGIHTFIRPVGGALVALAVVDASDPGWQVAAFLAGGGAALLSHGAKTGTRAVVNASPEPFSNVAVSAAEDVATAGGLWLALANPVAAAVVAVVVLATAVALLVVSWRLLTRIRGWSRARSGR